MAAPLPPPLVAHRGWTRRAPENTLAALDAALGVGAGWVEVDVQLARDGVPFLFHDRTLERVTGAEGPLGARTAAELAAHQIALAAAAYLLPGVQISSWPALAIGALVLGFVNAIVRPIMVILTLPITRMGAAGLARRIDAFLTRAWVRTVIFVSALLWFWLVVLAGTAEA